MALTLNFRQLGQGSPLIILHGIFGSSDNWLTVSKSFAENNTVYLVDQRNHGRSPHTDEMNYKVMSEDLKDFIEQHNLENPIIIGHSMGGKVAMNYATQNQNFSKLIVVDIAPRRYRIDYTHYLEGMETMDLPALANRQQAEEHLLPFVPEAGVRQFLLKNLYRDENGNFAWRINLPVIDGNMNNIGEPLPENAISDKPTLFIRGENSDYIQDKDWETILKHFPKAKLETVSGAGHWVQADQPADFIEKVRAFI